MYWKTNQIKSIILIFFQIFYKNKYKIYNIQMSLNNICYDGMGARKSGNHTRKQFLQVMNKNLEKTVQNIKNH